ncbi:uncharacterized protein LOC113273989 isoform X4 [Papaver somniferum]|uniref:uncharacterized protein LOC113273989 isoform X4 n=1 Tax=Papaver somniferum TaxID=3469 RepID=UPI000E700E81|nr:uncharacterized protein LOC113273989 isoform X4 [Papaver somniferum]
MMHHSFSLLPQFSSSFLPSTRTLCPPNLFSTSTIPCESSSKETGLEQSEKKKNGSYLLDSLHTSRFCSCGRRHFIGFSATSLLPVSSSSNASDSQSNSNVHLLSPLISNLPQNLWAMLNRVHPPKPDWYEEFFALVMEKGMASYEDEVAGYKEKLFSSLRGRKCKDVLELGIGTGPNLKYYAGDVGVHVYGVDPNKKMEKYAAAAALAAGLPSTNFYYTQAVGEALPANDASMDAVVGTLVLCSVKDVKATLKGLALLSFGHLLYNRLFISSITIKNTLSKAKILFYHCYQK